MKIPSIVKSRTAAAIVLAAAVLIFTPLGSKLSLERAVRNVENGFYEGVYVEDGDYTSGSISLYLSDSCRAALGLVTVGVNYSELSSSSDGLRSAREALLDATSISAMGKANAGLVSAYEAFLLAAAPVDFSGHDLESFHLYCELFEQSQSAISRNPYNASVADFKSNIFERFPADIISHAFSISGPQFFGEDK